MQVLEKIIQPSLGIITNIGSAHDQGFSNRFEKAKEKCKLFKNCKALIYPAEYEEIRFAVENLNSEGDIQLLAWSSDSSSAFRVLRKDSADSDFIQGELHEFIPPFTDSASFEKLNSLHLYLSIWDISMRKLLPVYYCLNR